MQKEKIDFELLKTKDKPTGPKDYITPEEISEVLGIGMSATNTLIRSNWFPSLPYGKKLCQYTIPRTAFEKLINDPDRIVVLKQKLLEINSKGGDVD